MAGKKKILITEKKKIPLDIHYRHTYLCKFVQYINAEVENWKKAQSLNNIPETTAVKWQTFFFLQCS